MSDREIEPEKRARARETVRAWIEDLSGESAIDESSNLVESGILQSLHVLQLVGFVSDAFGIEVTAADVYDGHLASIDTIVSFVAKAKP